MNATKSTYVPMMYAQAQVPSGKYTFDGVPLMTPPIKVGCSPIIWRQEMGASSVRTDTSGSQSSAEEFTGFARFLIEPAFTPQNGMKLTVQGHPPLRVVEVFPRYSFGGALHHWQVDLERWLQESE